VVGQPRDSGLKAAPRVPGVPPCSVARGSSRISEDCVTSASSRAKMEVFPLPDGGFVGNQGQWTRRADFASCRKRVAVVFRGSDGPTGQPEIPERWLPGAADVFTGQGIVAGGSSGAGPS